MLEHIAADPVAAHLLGRFLEVCAGIILAVLALAAWDRTRSR